MSRLRLIDCNYVQYREHRKRLTVSEGEVVALSFASATEIAAYQAVVFSVTPRRGSDGVDPASDVGQLATAVRALARRIKNDCLSLSCIDRGHRLAGHHEKGLLVNLRW